MNFQLWNGNVNYVHNVISAAIFTTLGVKKEKLALTVQAVCPNINFLNDWQGDPMWCGHVDQHPWALHLCISQKYLPQKLPIQTHISLANWILDTKPKIVGGLMVEQTIHRRARRKREQDHFPQSPLRSYWKHPKDLHEALPIKSLLYLQNHIARRQTFNTAASVGNLSSYSRD